jgi:SAM-dependent methyltransferase
MRPSPAAVSLQPGAGTAYGPLAAVYEWLVPDSLLTPDGAVDAFAPIVQRLPAGAAVLDCASGTGQLAVGLAARGFAVVASDAEPAMIDRTRELARRHGVGLPAVTCDWTELADPHWAGRFDAVFCVGNSLPHAAGRTARRDSLGQMAAVLRPGGLLVLTSRNWEQVRAAGSHLEVAEHLVRRDGRQGLVTRHWSVARTWSAEHTMEVAVSLLEDDGGVLTVTEQLSFWPFRKQDLDADLWHVGLVPETSTYRPDVERYQVTARRPSA